MSNQGKIITAIAVGIFGVVIGATVLVLLSRGDVPEKLPDETNVVQTESVTIAPETAEPTSGSDKGTEATEISEAPTTGETLPPVTDAPEGETTAASILGSWEPESACFTGTGESISLTDIYGQGYKTYGGELIFKSDNTFSINIGITDDGDSNNGKYSCTADSVNVLYNSDKEEVFDLNFASDGSVEKILVPQGDFTVTFVRK